MKIQILRIPIVISPDKLDNNLDEIIYKHIKKLEAKTIKNVGIIMKINKILKYEGGDVQLDTGNVKFKVEVEVELYSPKIGEIIKSKITTISNSGIYINEYPEIENWDGIFIHFKPINYNVGDEVKIEIKQVKYHNNSMIVTGILVEQNKDNKYINITPKIDIDSVNKDETNKTTKKKTTKVKK